jgi:hypothetical protein
MAANEVTIRTMQQLRHENNEKIVIYGAPKYPNQTTKARLDRFNGGYHGYNFAFHSKITSRHFKKNGAGMTEAARSTAWKRALEEPISDETPWELLDEFRRELFRQLELLTEWSLAECEDPSLLGPWLAAEIQKIAERLKLLAVLVPAAGERAVASGRAKTGWLSPHCPLCQQKLKKDCA